MLTIRNALELPAFQQAKLVAGQNGLDHIIRWVHIVDVPNARYEWVKGQELILTAGVGLKDDPQRQKNLIPTLVKKGLSGIVFSLGHYLDEIPETILAAADELNFPLITLPPEAPFIAITEQIFTHIVNAQYALRQRAEEIHHTLTQLVLDGGSMQEVSETLAALLDRSVTVENTDLEVLAAAQVGGIDDARTRSVAAGRTTPEAAQYLRANQVYERLLKEGRPVRIEALPHLDMHMERIVAPIVVARQMMGYMWIISGGRPLDELDTLAIEHGATVAALLMLKEQAVRKTEMTQRGDLLELLIGCSADLIDPALSERAHRLGFPLNQTYSVWMIASPAASFQAASNLSYRIEKWLSQEGFTSLAAPREMHIAVILIGQQTPPISELAERLCEAFQTNDAPNLIAISRPVQHIDGIKTGYAEAAETLDIARKLGRTTGVFLYENLGVLHPLYHLAPDVLVNDPWMDTVQKLAVHDEIHHSDLLHTLEIYLNTGGVVGDAAARLNVHRNTLVYRLEQIQEASGVDLKKPENRMSLHFMIKAYRLTGSVTPPLK